MNTLNNIEHVVSVVLGAEHRGAAPQMKQIITYMISLLPGLRREVSTQKEKDEWYLEGARFKSDERVIRDALKSIQDPQEYMENPILKSLIPDLLRQTLVSLASTDYYYTHEKQW